MTEFVNIGTRTAGDDYLVELTIVDEEENPLNINGLLSAKFQLHRHGELEFAKLLGSGIEITDGPAGQMSIVWLAEDTEGLSGTFEFEVEIIDGDGNYQTPAYGVVEFRRALIANES